MSLPRYREATDEPCIALTHEFGYLQRLALVDDSWRIVLAVTPICRARYAALDVNYSGSRAVIHINAEYVFTRQSASRAVMHELLELATIDMWRVSQATLRKVPVVHRADLEAQARRARDVYIERRLRVLPFWDDTDLPVLRRSLDKLCRFSSPSKATTVSASQPRLLFCTTSCGCADSPSS